jgi:hypothetical protein
MSSQSNQTLTDLTAEVKETMSETDSDSGSESDSEVDQMKTSSNKYDLHPTTLQIMNNEPSGPCLNQDERDRRQHNGYARIAANKLSETQLLIDQKKKQFRIGLKDLITQKKQEKKRLLDIMDIAGITEVELNENSSFIRKRKSNGIFYSNIVKTKKKRS